MTANYVGVNVTHLCSFVFMGAMISSSPRGGSDRFVMGSAVKTSLGHAAKHGFDVLVRLAGMLKTYNEEETIGYVVMELPRDCCAQVEVLVIKLINELSIIFEKMGLNTKDALDAASTKWNFQRYSPGLVGGHCIPVDPYYPVHRAKELGYHPQVILAGGAINYYMPKHVVKIAVKALNDVGKVIKNSRVLMGLTYKENVADTRETPVVRLVKKLKEFGIRISGFDHLLWQRGIEAFGIGATDDIRGIRADYVIMVVAHDAFKSITLSVLKKMVNGDPISIDIRGMFDRDDAERM